MGQYNLGRMERCRSKAEDSGSRAGDFQMSSSRLLKPDLANNASMKHTPTSIKNKSLPVMTGMLHIITWLGISGVVNNPIPYGDRPFILH